MGTNWEEYTGGVKSTGARTIVMMGGAYTMSKCQNECSIWIHQQYTGTGFFTCLLSEGFRGEGNWIGGGNLLGDVYWLGSSARGIRGAGES